MSKTAAERQILYRERHPDQVKESKKRWEQENYETYVKGNRRRNKRYSEKLRNSGELTEVYRNKNERYRTTIDGVSAYLYWNAKRRAKVKEIAFELTKEFIINKEGEPELNGKLYLIPNNKAVRFNFDSQKLYSVDIWNEFVFKIVDKLCNKPTYTMYINTTVMEVLDVVKIGDIVKVKIIDKDPSGKLGLSMKALKERPKFEERKPEIKPTYKPQPVVEKPEVK
jgi:hypothetical protein